MNPRTGEIIEISHDEIPAKEQELGHRLIPLTSEDVNTLRPMRRRQRKNWMRNKPCPCGSERKFKKCCWHTYE